MTTDRTPAELLGAYMALFDAAGDAALWLEAEAEHPRPDPRPAMVAQAKLLRRILADPPALATQLAEEQAKVAEQLAAAALIGFDPARELTDPIVHSIMELVRQCEAKGAEKERERLRAILNDHQPYQERYAMECDNGLCGHEPYLDHVLALLAEEGKGRLW